MGGPKRRHARGDRKVLTTYAIEARMRSRQIDISLLLEGQVYHSRKWITTNTTNDCEPSFVRCTTISYIFQAAWCPDSGVC